jgi:hypothetical protein
MKKLTARDFKEIVKAYKQLTGAANALKRAFEKDKGWSALCEHRKRKVDPFDGEIMHFCKKQEFPTVSGKKFRECRINGCPLGD